jgi:hypothetical protein
MNMLALAAHHKHRRCQHPSPDAAISSASDFKMLVSADEDKGTRKPSLRSKIMKASPPTSANLRKSLTSSFTKIMGKKNDLFDLAPDEERDSKTEPSSSDIPKEMDARTASTPANSSQTSHTLDDVLTAQVGSSVVKYLEQCLSTEINVLDRVKFEAIPEFNKTDLVIAGHIGKGTYSDVFEVGVTVSAYEAKYKESVEKSVMDELDLSLHGTFGTMHVMDELDLSRHRTFGTMLNDEKAPETEIKNEGTASSTPRTDRRPSRRSTRRISLHSSAVISAKGLTRPKKHDERTMVYAMKCLRPCIRSNPEQFIIGAEDLVHETAMLASINHENIIKIHGRAGGDLSTAFKLNDGYFILLDKLSSTLKERIDEWKWNLAISDGAASPTLDQIDVAHSIANAIAYLHSKNIAFRDLKPVRDTGCLPLCMTTL